MGAAFGWIGELIEWFADLFPRFTIVRKTHGGVAFVAGKYIREVKPGLYWWWPAITELEVYPVKFQTLDLPTQTLTTSDNKSVIAGAVVGYVVKDIKTALTEQWDLADTIGDLCAGAVSDFVTEKEFNWINSNRAVAKRHLTKALTEVLSEYGVGVRYARLTDFAQCRVISMIGGSTAVLEEDDE